MNTINCNGFLLDLSEPKIMGILNVTPDSFFDGGKYYNDTQIELRTKQILEQGADIIDVGAYSSRPGANDVPENEEIKRLDNALSIVRKNFPDACISVDTFRANVAKYVIEKYNVQIINDIYAGQADNKMLETVAKYNRTYIMMHMQGTPQTMQNNPHYNDVVNDIIYFFSEKIKKAALLGINDIIIDPGFGFGKTIEHNYQLMNRLDEFSIIEKPILVGISRKSMIYKFLNIKPDDALTGTIVLNTIALLKGASILRVHDVQDAVHTLKIVQKITDAND
jgi:dihydropteroate synthase